MTPVAHYGGAEAHERGSVLHRALETCAALDLERRELRASLRSAWIAALLGACLGIAGGASLVGRALGWY